jgi:hypothetical protein
MEKRSNSVPLLRHGYLKYVKFRSHTQVVIIDPVLYCDAVGAEYIEG